MKLDKLNAIVYFVIGLGLGYFVGYLFDVLK